MPFVISLILSYHWSDHSLLCHSKLHDVCMASEDICNPLRMALTKHQILLWVKNSPEWYFNREYQFLSEIFLFLSF